MGGRVVEGTSLENWHTGNGIVSSNLTPSVVSQGKARRPWPHRVLPCVFSGCSLGVVLDRWPSGLRRRPGKLVYVKAYRGFESHPVRCWSDASNTLVKMPPPGRESVPGASSCGAEPNRHPVE